MIERCTVSRVIGSELVHVGTLWLAARGQERFSYAESYLARGETPNEFGCFVFCPSVPGGRGK